MATKSQVIKLAQKMNCEVTETTCYDGRFEYEIFAPPAFRFDGELSSMVIAWDTYYNETASESHNIAIERLRATELVGIKSNQ